MIYKVGLKSRFGHFMSLDAKDVHQAFAIVAEYSQTSESAFIIQGGDLFAEIKFPEPEHKD